MFKKILVAFDGSEHAFHALDRAIELAKEHGGEIGLATVVNLPELPRGERIKKDHLSGKRTPFQKELERAAMKVMQEDLAVTTSLLRGQSARALANFCENNNYDCIIAGARGRNQQKNSELGGFVNQLVHNLPGKIIVVKGSEKPGEIKTA